jgi:hypothetical protein
MSPARSTTARRWSLAWSRNPARRAPPAGGDDPDARHQRGGERRPRRAPPADQPSVAAAWTPSGRRGRRRRRRTCHGAVGCGDAGAGPSTATAARRRRGVLPARSGCRWGSGVPDAHDDWPAGSLTSSKHTAARRPGRPAPSTGAGWDRPSASGDEVVVAADAAVLASSSPSGTNAPSWPASATVYG